MTSQHRPDILRDYRLNTIARCDEALIRTELNIALQKNRIGSVPHLDGEQAALLLATLEELRQIYLDRLDALILTLNE